MKNIEKKLAALISILYSLEYDVDEDGSYGPCVVNGIWNPDLAWRLRSRTQGKIYRLMEKSGMPLKGWNQFDPFIDIFTRNGHNVAAAYLTVKDNPVYIWEF